MARAENELREGGTLELFARSYATYFSPRFLFTDGDPILRHSLDGWGQLHWFELLTVPLGVAATLLRHRRHDVVLLAWLLLAPVPAALTIDHHALRDIAAAPAFAALSGIGMAALLERARKTSRREHALALALGAGVVAGGVRELADELYVDYRLQATAVWQHGIEQVVDELRDADAPCRVVTDEFFLPHVFIAYFAPLDPREYQQSPVRSITQSSGAIGEWELGGWRIQPLARAAADRECAIAAPARSVGSLREDPGYRELAAIRDPLGTSSVVVFRLEGGSAGTAAGSSPNGGD